MAGNAPQCQKSDLYGIAALAHRAPLLILAAVFAAGLAWAKWVPYAQKASHLSGTHTWPGGTLFADSGRPGAAPTLSGAWHFTSAYFQEVWKGFLVALVIAAVFGALVPGAWLVSLLNRRTRLGQAAAGGVTALPSLMCTCCTSPLVVGLRRRGVSTTARRVTLAMAAVVTVAGLIAGLLLWALT